MKGTKMKYCKICKRIHNDDAVQCENCKKSKFDTVSGDTPVYIASASGFELQRIETALKDNNVPCTTVAQKKNYSASVVTGTDYAEYDILVPYSLYEKAYDVCVGIGAIADDESQILDENGNPVEIDNEMLEEMSDPKRTVIRVLSVIFLLLIISGVVLGTDFIMKFLMNLF